MGKMRKKVRNTSIMEKIITFLPGQLPGEELFGIEMTGITYPDSRYRVDREHSNVHCLEYVIRGKGQIWIDGRLYEPREGDAYLLAAGKTHHYQADGKEPWEKIWMNVSGSLSDSLVNAYGLAEQVVFRDCPVYPLFQEFLHVCTVYEKNSRKLAERTVLLFHEILLNLAEHSILKAENGESMRGPALWIKEYIDGHIYDKLGIEELAAQVNLSPSQMTRVFKKAYGRSPYDYILSRKMDTACLLLSNTGMAVKEIAYLLNFADEHYFSNLFKQRIGMPPGRYRTEGWQRAAHKA